MRFVSHIRKFGVGIVEARVHFTQYGDRMVDREGYIAQFNQDDVTERDVEAARKIFEEDGSVHGRTTMLDEVTPSPLRNRISVFDTEETALRENWDPAFKEHVEQVLSVRSQNHPDFRMIEEEPVAPPWPRYADFNGSLDELIQKLLEDGGPEWLSRALAYEQRYLKRPAVVQRLEMELHALEEQSAPPQQLNRVPA